MDTTQELIEAIRARGGKVTPQRLAVYAALRGDATHPSAEVIYERVRETMPTVSLGTVYKTLNELVALGQARRFDVGGVSHFDPRTDPHGEVVCLGCGRIVDVALPGELVTPPIAGFEIVGQTQTFYGYCASCREDAHGPKSDRTERGNTNG